jgi:hypothetical protein
MTHDRRGPHGPVDRDRILRQLDKMLASGRITAEEADRLRSADPEEFEAAVRAISGRHVSERKSKSGH